MNRSDFKDGCPLRGRLKTFSLILFAGSAALAAHASPSNSVARVWDERALSAIRVDTPHPPAQARNLFSLSVCMYDAWAAYETNGAVGFIYRSKHTAPDVAAARSNAISYAAYRMLRERHYYSKTAAATFLEDCVPIGEMMGEIEHDRRRIADDETGECDQHVVKRQISTHQKENP